MHEAYHPINNLQNDSKKVLSMRYVGTRYPLAEHNPLRSVPFMRSRAEVFGPTPLEAAQIKLAQLRSYLPSLVEGLAYACQSQGRANRMPQVTRRRWQAQAIRSINQGRAGVRRLLKAIAAAEADLRALAHCGRHADPCSPLPRRRYGLRARPCGCQSCGPHQAAS